MKGWTLDQRTYAGRLKRFGVAAYYSQVPSYWSPAREAKLREFKETGDPRLLLEFLPSRVVTDLLCFKPSRKRIFAVRPPTLAFFEKNIEKELQEMAPICATRAAELLGFLPLSDASVESQKEDR